jgi:hypothetical protein
MLCLPALLRVWPLAPSGDRRARPSFDAVRALCWFPYCGLFATLFFPPSADDALGLLRFFAITLAAGMVCIVMGLLMLRWGRETARGVYRRAVAPYAGLVLVLVVITSFLMK